jgi:glycosyltransferase involved in cell wall biosynthesis
MTLNHLSLLHVVPNLNPGIGGPAASVPGLAAALSRAGVASLIASLDYTEYGTSVPLADASLLTVQPGLFSRGLRGWSPPLRAAIERAGRNSDLIHSHGLWMVPGTYARRTAERFGVPLLISPRGMLDSWSLDRSRAKKRLATWLYERRNLRSARLFHATSDLEVESIRRFGLSQPIAVLPNGMSLPTASEVPLRGALEGRFPALSGKRWLLFLSRLDSKKGLDLLLQLWREMGPHFPDWQLVVAGPDLEGFGARSQAAVDADEVLRPRTTFTGMLEGVDKAAALAGADIFALPTRGENFGVAIAESLAYGTPVITTTAAPWEDLLRYECGWWVAPELGAFGAGLEAALRTSQHVLGEMGQRGRVLVRERLDWEAIAHQWIKVYRWMLVGGSPPPCVRFA